MAKSRSPKDEPSTMGEFRAIFKDNPRLLRLRSNESIANLWLKSHPEFSELPKKARSSMANVKSILKNKKRKRGQKVADQAAIAAGRKPKRVIPATLDNLEYHIDDCMAMAKNIDRDKLDNVLKLLRRARNEVVLMG